MSDWIASAQHEDFPRIGEKVISSGGIPGQITFVYAKGAFDVCYDFRAAIKCRSDISRTIISGWSAVLRVRNTEISNSQFAKITLVVTSDYCMMMIVRAGWGSPGASRETESGS